MTLFPSVLTSYSAKVNGQVIDASDVNNLQTDVQQIEAVIGVAGASSTVGTYEYDVRSPASGGGGHVQVANKGGTGQTSFNKGDLLVGQSSSVVSKLAIGTDGQILSADSTATTGVSWINNSKPKLQTNASLIVFPNNTESSLITASVAGSTLGTNNAMRATGYVTVSDIRSSVLIRGVYGGARITSVMVRPPAGANQGAVVGEIKHTLIANNSQTAQRSYLEVTLATQPDDTMSSPRSSVFTYFDTQVSSVDSGAAKVMGVTAIGSSGLPQIAGYIVEKIN